MTIGFIGAGNMGGALAAAVAKTVGGSAVCIADADAAKAEALAARLGAQATDNGAVAANCDYIFLGVKPQGMAGLLRTIAPVLSERTKPAVLVSMAAGTSTIALTQMLGYAYPIIRIMPNTPALVGEGMILFSPTAEVDSAQVAEFQNFMTAAGRLCAISEGQIDAASAVSGCGPAFVYLFIEALADGGVECGLPRSLALELAAQTVLGSACMVQQTGQHPGQLKDAVCSPGGTTIAGVHALESGAFRALAMDAVKAAYDRTCQLAEKK